MIVLIAFGAGFALGMLAGQGKLIPWVRGAAGKARDAVLGLRPARAVMAGYNARAENKADSEANAANSVLEGYKPEVSPPPANKPISAGKAIANVLGFFGGLLAWMAKNPVLAIGLVLLACLLVFGLPFGMGKSKGELRLEREIAEMTATVREHEAHLAEISRDLAVNTERDRTRRTQVITQAQQEIEDATVQVDAEAQYRAYERGYLCLLNVEACGDSSDPAPAGTDPVRSPNADAA